MTAEANTRGVRTIHFLIISTMLIGIVLSMLTADSPGKFLRTAAPSLIGIFLSFSMYGGSQVGRYVLALWLLFQGILIITFYVLILDSVNVQEISSTDVVKSLTIITFFVFSLIWTVCAIVLLTKPMQVQVTRRAAIEEKSKAEYYDSLE